MQCKSLVKPLGLICLNSESYTHLTYIYVRACVCVCCIGRDNGEGEVGFDLIQVEEIIHVTMSVKKCLSGSEAVLYD